MGRYLLLTLFLFVQFSSSARTGILERIITINIKSTPISLILKTIEKKGDVIFSYDPNQIHEDKIVSLSITEKTIEYGLSLIFDGTVRFKEVGNHIVLLKNEDKEEIKERKKQGLNYTFTGRLSDKRTGNPIVGASVYDVDARYAAITDSKGHYELIIPRTESVRSLYFKKRGYFAKVIVIIADEETNWKNNIVLKPVEHDIDKKRVSGVKKIDSPLEERALSGALISEDAYIHSENLWEIDEVRKAQISLVPSVSIGSNLSTNGMITNNFSLNVLAGYSNGVDGFEIGGLLNMVKGNVEGVQIGGIANLVGGNVRGFQAGGIASLVQGDVDGCQVSGISSIIRGGFHGAQVGGVSNIAFDKSTGWQIAGVVNSVFDTLVGGQISGVVNYAYKGVNQMQISGVSNIAHINRGAQITSIFNRSLENRGLQIGLINTSRRGNGAAIGLFNFVREGYHKTEISSNEVFQANVTLKTGTQRLYNSYHFGYKFGANQAIGFGLGLGSYFNLFDKAKLSLDLTGDMVFENDFTEFEFNQLYKISTTFDYQIKDWVAVFGGPSVNANFMRFKNSEGVFETNVPTSPIYSKSGNTGIVAVWIGAQIGLRF